MSEVDKDVRGLIAKTIVKLRSDPKSGQGNFSLAE
jgi:hypothetical protein